MPPLRSPQQVMEHEFLDARSALIEVAGALDRYDRSVAASGSGADSDTAALADQLRQAAAILAEADASPDRAERMLLLFTDPEDLIEDGVVEGHI